MGLAAYPQRGLGLRPVAGPLVSPDPMLLKLAAKYGYTPVSDGELRRGRNILSIGGNRVLHWSPSRGLAEFADSEQGYLELDAYLHELRGMDVRLMAPGTAAGANSTCKTCGVRGGRRNPIYRSRECNDCFRRRKRGG